MHTYPYALKRIFFLVYWFSVYKTITKTKLYKKTLSRVEDRFPLLV